MVLKNCEPSSVNATTVIVISIPTFWDAVRSVNVVTPFCHNSLGISLSLPLDKYFCLSNLVNDLTIPSNTWQSFGRRYSSINILMASDIIPFSNACKGSIGHAALKIPNLHPP